MLSILGSLLGERRYNIRGVFGALYLSSTPALTRAERVRHAGGDPANLPPQSIGAIQVKLTRVLDLTDPAVLKRLGAHVRDLTHPTDYSLTQKIAAAARAVGFEAILYPPVVASPGHNWAVFSDRLSRGSSVRALKVQDETPA